MHKRLFLSLPIPHTTQMQLHRYSTQLALHNTSVVIAENIHITLYFLDSIDERFIPDLTERCKHLYAQSKKFNVPFDTITFAPPHAPGRMLWAQYHCTLAFGQLAEITKIMLTDWGKNYGIRIENNNKQCIPHTTLARCKDPFNTPHTQLPPLQVPDLLVDCIQLIESELNQAGSRYTILETFNFDGITT